MQAMAHRKLTSLARIALVLLQEAEALAVAGDSPSSKPHSRDLKDPDARVPLSVLSGVWRHLVTRDTAFDQRGLARVGPCPADGTGVFHGVSSKPCRHRVYHLLPTLDPGRG